MIADETKDCSKIEQMTISIRYVETDGVICERFLTSTELSNLNTLSLSNYILNVLQQFQLDPQWIVSQCYDGAAVMSGRCSGVQQRLRAVALNARYIHCYAHTLNLVLVDS